jgi:predicted transcriptional regulator
MPQLLPQIQPLPEPNHGNDDTTPTTQSDEAMEQPPTLSQAKMEEVARLMEERRKERMKTLTRNLEVCDLLDIRNPQSVAEFAPQIYRYLHSEELNHMYP